MSCLPCCGKKTVPKVEPTREKASEPGRPIQKEPPAQATPRDITDILHINGKTLPPVDGTVHGDYSGQSEPPAKIDVSGGKITYNSHVHHESLPITAQGPTQHPDRTRHSIGPAKPDRLSISNEHIVQAKLQELAGGHGLHHVEDQEYIAVEKELACPTTPPPSQMVLENEETSTNNNNNFDSVYGTSDINSVWVPESTEPVLELDTNDNNRACSESIQLHVTPDQPCLPQNIKASNLTCDQYEKTQKNQEIACVCNESVQPCLDAKFEKQCANLKTNEELLNDATVASKCSPSGDNQRHSSPRQESSEPSENRDTDGNNRCNCNDTKKEGNPDKGVDSCTGVELTLVTQRPSCKDDAYISIEFSSHLSNSNEKLNVTSCSCAESDVECLTMNNDCASTKFHQDDELPTITVCNAPDMEERDGNEHCSSACALESRKEHLDEPSVDSRVDSSDQTNENNRTCTESRLVMSEQDLNFSCTCVETYLGPADEEFGTLKTVEQTDTNYTGAESIYGLPCYDINVNNRTDTESNFEVTSAGSSRTHTPRHQRDHGNSTRPNLVKGLPHCNNTGIMTLYMANKTRPPSGFVPAYPANYPIACAGMYRLDTSECAHCTTHAGLSTVDFMQALVVGFVGALLPGDSLNVQNFWS